MSGRTQWRQDDCDFNEREWTTLIGQEFGPMGPAVMVELERMAKKQGGSGRVKTGVSALARKIFVRNNDDVVTVGHVLSRLVQVGYLSDVEEEFGVFKATIAWYKADQTAGGNAERKQAQRRREAEKLGDPALLVTSCHDESQESQNVTLRIEESKLKERENAGARTEIAEANSNDDPADLCRVLVDLIADRDPGARTALEPLSVAAQWIEPMRQLVADRDGDRAEIERVLRWAQQDPFWRSRASTPASLKTHFVQIRDQSLTRKPAGGTASRKPAPVAGRRAASPGQQPIRAQAAGACPGCDDLATIAVFEKITQEISAKVGDQTWKVWLNGLHPHRTVGATVELGCDPDRSMWVGNRFDKLLKACAGQPVTVVPCHGPAAKEAA